MRATPLTTAIDSFMREALGRHFSDASLVVLHRGKTIIDASWSVDDTRKKPPLFDIASITKLFTTTLILRLIAEGHLSLDTKVGEIISEFILQNPRPLSSAIDPHTLNTTPLSVDKQGVMVDVSTINIRHLLTHTSGLQAWLDIFRKIAPTAPSPTHCANTFEQQALSLKAINLISHHGLLGVPSAQVAYSDLGFILLGEVASRVAKKPLATLITEQVIAPLKVEVLFNPLSQGVDSRRIPPTEDDKRWRGYRAHGAAHDENAHAMGGVAGHAGLFATANAIATLGEVWQSPVAVEKTWGINALLAKVATQEIAKDKTSRRGLGFMLKASDQDGENSASCGPHFSHDSFGHTGYTGTSLWVDPRQNCVAAFLSNAVYYGRNMQMLKVRQGLHTVLATYLY